MRTTIPLHDDAAPYSAAVAEHDWIMLAGQVDADNTGRVGHPGDPAAQTAAAIGNIERLLRQLDADLRDLVKLVVFYVQPGVEEAGLQAQIGALLGDGAAAVITLVPLRQLRYAGLAVEMDAYAMRSGDKTAITLPELPDPGPGLCHGLSCDEFVFVGGQSSADATTPVRFAGDLVSQNRQTLDNLHCILNGLGVDVAQIVKANSWRASPPSAGAYAQAARDRFEFFSAARPAVTGITIPGLAAVGHLIRLDLWAVRAPLPRTHVMPPDHWGWQLETTYSHGLQCGDWLFVGGQAALDRDCHVQQPENPLTQTEITMAFVQDVLRSAGVDFENVLKINTYSTGRSDERQQHLHALNRYFKHPGPASTCVPVDSLAYAGQVVEVEAIACAAPAPGQL